MDERKSKYANYEHSEISNLIFQAFYTVYNELGFCFEKSVYLKSLIVELENLGLKCQPQQKHPISYKSHEVGEYVVDILVDKKVMLQIQTSETITNHDEQKLYQYLRASEITVGFILNFGKEPSYVRKKCAAENKHRKQ